MESLLDQDPVLDGESWELSSGEAEEAVEEEGWDVDGEEEKDRRIATRHDEMETPPLRRNQSCQSLEENRDQCEGTWKETVAGEQPEEDDETTGRRASDGQIRPSAARSRRRKRNVSLNRELADRLTLVEGVRKRTANAAVVRQKRLDRFRDRVNKNTLTERIFGDGSSQRVSVQDHFSKVQNSEQSLLETANKLMKLTATWNTGSIGSESSLEEATFDSQLGSHEALTLLLDSLPGSFSYRPSIPIDEREQIVENSKKHLGKMVSELSEISRQTKFRGFGNWLSRQSRGLDIDNCLLADQLEQTNEIDGDLEKQKELVEADLYDAELKEYTALNKFYEELQMKSRLVSSRYLASAALKAPNGTEKLRYSLHDQELQKHELQVQASILAGNIEEKQSLLDIRMKRLEQLTVKQEETEETKEATKRAIQTTYDRKLNKFLHLMNQHQEELTDLKSVVRDNRKEMTSCLAAVEASGDEALLKTCKEEIKRLDILLSGKDPAKVAKAEQAKEKKRSARASPSPEGEDNPITRENSTVIRERERRRKEKQKKKIQREKDRKKRRNLIEQKRKEVASADSAVHALRTQVDEKEKDLRHQSRKSRREIQLQGELKKLQATMAGIIASQESRDNSLLLAKCRQDHKEAKQKVDKASIDVEKLRRKVALLKKENAMERGKLDGLKGKRAIREGKYDETLHGEILAEKGEIEHHSNFMAEFVELDQAEEENKAEKHQIEEEMKAYESQIQQAQEHLAIEEQEIMLLGEGSIDFRRGMESDGTDNTQRGVSLDSQPSPKWVPLSIDIRVLIRAIPEILAYFQALNPIDEREFLVKLNASAFLNLVEVQAQSRYKILKVSSKVISTCSKQIAHRESQLQQCGQQIKEVQEMIQTQNRERRALGKANEESYRELEQIHQTLLDVEESLKNQFTEYLRQWDQVALRGGDEDVQSTLRSQLTEMDAQQQRAKALRADIRMKEMKHYLNEIAEVRSVVGEDNSLVDYALLSSSQTEMRAECNVLNYVLLLSSALACLNPLPGLNSFFEAVHESIPLILGSLERIKGNAKGLCTSSIRDTVRTQEKKLKDAEIILQQQIGSLSDGCTSHFDMWEKMMLFEKNIIDQLQSNTNASIELETLETQSAHRIAYQESCKGITRLWLIESSEKGLFDSAVVRKCRDFGQSASSSIAYMQSKFVGDSLEALQSLESISRVAQETLLNIFETNNIIDADKPMLSTEKGLFVKGGDFLWSESLKPLILKREAEQAQFELESTISQIDRGPEFELEEANKNLASFIEKKRTVDQEVLFLVEQITKMTQSVQYAENSGENDTKIRKLKAELSQLQELLQETKDQSEQFEKVISTARERINTLEILVNSDDKEASKAQQPENEIRKSLAYIRRDLCFLAVGFQQSGKLFVRAARNLKALPKHFSESVNFFSLFHSNEHAVLVGNICEELEKSFRGIFAKMEVTKGELLGTSELHTVEEISRLRTTLQEIFQELNDVTVQTISLARLADLGIGKPNHIVPAIDLQFSDRHTTSESSLIPKVSDSPTAFSEETLMPASEPSSELSSEQTLKSHFEGGSSIKTKRNDKDECLEARKADFVGESSDSVLQRRQTQMSGEAPADAAQTNSTVQASKGRTPTPIDSETKDEGNHLAALAEGTTGKAIEEVATVSHGTKPCIESESLSSVQETLPVEHIGESSLIQGEAVSEHHRGPQERSSVDMAPSLAIENVSTPEIANREQPSEKSIDLNQPALNLKEAPAKSSAPREKHPQDVLGVLIANALYEESEESNNSAGNLLFYVRPLPGSDLDSRKVIMKEETTIVAQGDLGEENSQASNGSFSLKSVFGAARSLFTQYETLRQAKENFAKPTSLAEERKEGEKMTTHSFVEKDSGSEMFGKQRLSFKLKNISSLRAHVESLKARKEKVEDNLEAKKATMNSIEKRRILAAKVLASISQEDRKTLHRIAELKEKLFTAAVGIANMELKLESLSKEYERLQKAASDFSISSDSILEENLPLFKTMLEKEQRASKYNLEQNEWKWKISNLESLDNVEEELGSHLAKLRPIRQQHDQAVKAVSELKSQIEQQHRRLEAEDHGPALLHTANTIRKSILLLKEELKSLNKITLDSASLSHQARIHQIRDERERMEKEIEELERKVGVKRKKQVSQSNNPTSLAAQSEEIVEIDKDNEEMELERRVLQYEKQLLWWEHRWETREGETA